MHHRKKYSSYISIQHKYNLTVEISIYHNCERELSRQEKEIETFGNWDENGESVREKAKRKGMHKKKI